MKGILLFPLFAPNFCTMYPLSFTAKHWPEHVCGLQQQQPPPLPYNMAAGRVPRKSVFAGASTTEFGSVSGSSLDRWGDLNPDQAVRMVRPLLHHPAKVSETDAPVGSGRSLGRLG